MRVLEILFESPEARIEYLAKTMGQKLVAAAEKDASMKEKEPEKIAAALAEFDPTPNKKALSFIAKLYVTGAIRAEDKKKINSSILLFYRSLQFSYLLSAFFVTLNHPPSLFT